MEETKICIKCEKEKMLSHFYFRNDNKKYRNECILCNNERKKLYHQKNIIKINESRLLFRENNREKLSMATKNYRINNPEKHKESINKWVSKNKLHRKNYQKLYKQRNKNNRNIKDKERKLVDSLYKLKHNIRNLIRLSFKKKNLDKNSKTTQILGCSFEQFKQHLESKFEPWMNWKNHGFYNGELNYGWDIDHIIPLNTSKTEDDIIKLNHYTNLQPLCGYVNRNVKRDKILIFQI